MKWNPMSRRFFLQGLGSWALALPVLESLGGEEAFAQTAEEQKSLVLFFKPNGCYPEDYFPYDLYRPQAGLKVTDRGSQIRELDLSSLPGSISPVLGPAFDSVRSRLNIYLGLNPKNSNHNGAIPFATDANFPSIDQIVIRSPLYNKTGGQALALLGTKGFNIPSSFGFGGGQIRPLNHVNDALVLFQQLFGGNPPVRQGGGDTDLRFRKLVKDKKALDLVLEDYKRLQNSSVLSLGDKRILSDYMEFISAKQKMLSDLLAKGPMPVAEVKFPSKPAESVNSQEVSLTNSMLELMAAAIKTGVNHTFHFQLAASVDETNFPLNEPGYQRSAYHAEISHNESRRKDQEIVDRYLFGQVAKFYKLLDVPMPDGSSYADNALICVGGDIGAGAAPFLHTSHNAIALSLSGKKIPITTGRAISYASDPLKAGYPQNQFLISAMEAVGATDWKQILERGGIPRPGRGFGVYGGNQLALDEAQKDLPLPVLR
jgi:hypothetical protein